MNLINRISEHFSESAHLKLQSMDALAAPIAAAAERMVQCLRQDGKILACGNGGSAADSQHFAAELLNRFEMERPGLAAMHAAHENGMSVIALTGRNGGVMAEALEPSDIQICVAAQSTARIQEVHLLTLHCLCDAIDCLLLGVE